MQLQVTGLTCSCWSFSSNNSFVPTGSKHSFKDIQVPLNQSLKSLHRSTERQILKQYFGQGQWITQQWKGNELEYNIFFNTKCIIILLSNELDYNIFFFTNCTNTLYVMQAFWSAAFLYKLRLTKCFTSNITSNITSDFWLFCINHLIIPYYLCVF